jgi:peptide deformylase
MILPIVAYGDPVLKRMGDEIDEADQKELQDLLTNMWETMYNAQGVGLAAPQIGKSLRLFLVDSEQLEEVEGGIKKTFVNPVIEEESGEAWDYNEGCLSIPHVREDVSRQPKIKISYFDEHFNFFEEEYEGLNARIIQHEYDHVEGILFTDKLSPLKKKMIKKKLEDIAKGQIRIGYKMKFPMAKKKR